MAVELDVGGALRLAVPLGSARGAALSRILSLRGSPGWIAGVEVHQWRFEGVIERAGAAYLVGPPFSGRTLKQAMELDPAAALPLVSRAARALLLLSESPAGWFPAQADSVIIAEGGSVLVLPPAVDRELRDLRPFEEHRDTFEGLNHPDLAGEARTVFFLSAVLYRTLTGRFPFSGADVEELHSQQRGLEIQPPAVLVPGLEPEVSELVMAGLLRGRRGRLPLAELADALDRWKARPLVRPSTDEEKQAALSAASAGAAAAERSFRRRRFWQRHWRVAAIVAAGVIVAGALAGTILKSALAPRLTHGYAPAKVVETFYSSLNTLDHQAMEACVIGGAGKDLVNETMTLYVTSRVTQGYEGRSSVESAADWDKAGRPPLVPPQSLYGVTDLSISQEQGPPEPVFLVTYDLWNPAPRPDNDLSANGPPLSEGHAITDRLRLRQDHGDWVIYRMDRVSIAPLPPPMVGPPQPPGSGLPAGPGSGTQTAPGAAAPTAPGTATPTAPGSP